MSDPTAAPVEVVQAQRYELVDRNGRLRGVFGELPNPDETADPIVGVSLVDRNGNHRAFLSLEDEGPRLVFDFEGNNALELGFHDPTADALVVGAYGIATDADGRRVLGFRVQPDGKYEIKPEHSA